LRLTCSDYYLVDQGEVQAFDGDLDDYHQWLLDAAKAASANQTANSDDTKPAVDKKQQKRLEAELRQKVSPLKRKQAKLEIDQQKLSERLAELEHLLADGELYDQDNKAKLTSVLNERTSLTQTLEESEMQWLELQEEIDAMELELMGQ